LKKSKRHLSADELYDIVKKFMPRISLATVYRNLEILSETGVIRKLEISGRQKRFDFDVSDHDHIYCIMCHKVDNLNIARKSVDSEQLGVEAGYSITGYRVEVIGICPECRKKEISKEKK
jgi:Fur family ferric uptake transcriptional regulator